MRATSAFGTQANRRDCKLDVGITSMVLGAVAVLMVSIGGDISVDQEVDMNFAASAPVTTPMSSMSMPSR